MLGYALYVGAGWQVSTLRLTTTWPLLEYLSRHQALLVPSREGCCHSCHGSAWYAVEAAHLSSALVQQGPVGAGRKALLTWLISAADSSKQVPTTRAKAIKALGMVAEDDPRLLAFPTVQHGVNRALQVGHDVLAISFCSDGCSHSFVVSESVKYCVCILVRRTAFWSHKSAFAWSLSQVDCHFSCELTV